MIYINKEKKTIFDFWRKDFEEFRKFLPKGKIIDIGCGEGKDALFFKESYKFYQYIGIDVSPEMIREARKLVPGIIFLEMNMYEINMYFKRDSFDGFWVIDSLPHIPKDKIFRFGVFQKKIDIVLKQIRKVVKPDGIGFISVKENKDEFREILEKNGFEILKCEKDLKEHNSLTRNHTIYLKYFVKVKK